MHPPGSRWISPRASLIGLSTAALSVLLIFVVGLSAATFAVRGRTERATRADELRDAVRGMRTAAEIDGVWPVRGTDGLIPLVPELTATGDVPDAVLVAIRGPAGVTRSDLEDAALGEPATDRDRSIHENGFGFDRVDGPTLGQVLGPTGGVGVPAAFASGEVVVLQDEMPVSELWPFVAGSEMKRPDRERSLDLYRLTW